MKKLTMVLLMLPFMFLCNGIKEKSNDGSIPHSVEKSLIRVEIEHGNFSGDLKQESPKIVLIGWSENIKDLKIKGTDQSFKLEGYAVSDSHYTAGFKGSEKKLTKKLTYEICDKIDVFNLEYVINYSTNRKSNIDQDIPIKVKLYVGGKLKHEGKIVYKLRSGKDSSDNDSVSIAYLFTNDFFHIGTEKP